MREIKCDAETLLKALEDIYIHGRRVKYGKRDPFVTGQMTAIAQIALSKAYGFKPEVDELINANEKQFLSILEHPEND